MPLPRLSSKGMPGRTVYLDEMAPDALIALQQEAEQRLRELKDELADAEAAVEQIKIARNEQQSAA